MTFSLEAPPPPARKGGYMAKAKRSDTNTPPLVIELVLDVFGEIDLDPCSNPTSIVPARREVWLHHHEGARAALAERQSVGRVVEFGSGLGRAWEKRNYVNPPFDHLARWIRKCAGEWEMRRAQSILVCPARTDTKAFHAHVVTAPAFCLWKGRFTFLGEKHGCPFPPLFVYWGPDVERFEAAFSPHGKVFRT